MPEFAYQDCCRSAPTTRRTGCSPPTTCRRSRPAAGGSCRSIPRRSRCSPSRAMFDIAHLLRPGHLAQLAAILDDPEASPNDVFVALELLKNACIAAGGILPVVPGHRHRDREGQEGRARAHRRRRPRGDRARHLPHLRRRQPALLADGAAHHVRREEHRHEPARRDRDRSRSTATRTSSCSWPRAAARRTRACCSRRRRRCSIPTSLMRWLDEKLRTLGTAACPPYHLALVIGGTSAEHDAEDGEARVGALPRHAAARPATSSAAASATSSSKQQVLAAHAGVRHRRAVRRQVLLPRRARDPPAAPRRVVPGRARGLVLGRPPGARQDHRRRRVPRAARDRPRASTSPRSPTTHLEARRGRAHRPHPADGEIRETLSHYPGEDARDAERPDGRRARHRARQDQGAPRRGRRPAAVPEGLLRLLRRARPRRPRATRRVRSARPPPGAWTPTSTCSSATAARS